MSATLNNTFMEDLVASFGNLEQLKITVEEWGTRKTKGVKKGITTLYAHLVETAKPHNKVFVINLCIDGP